MYSRSISLIPQIWNVGGGGTKHDIQSTKNPSSRRISNLDVILSKLDTWRWKGLLFCTSFPFPPTCTIPRACQVERVVKNLPANAGEIRDAGWTLGSGRTPGGGYGNPLQYSYLENPMDRWAWQTIVCKLAKSQTRLRRLSTCTVHNSKGCLLSISQPLQLHTLCSLCPALSLHSCHACFLSMCVLFALNTLLSCV